MAISQSQTVALTSATDHDPDMISTPVTQTPSSGLICKGQDSARAIIEGEPVQPVAPASENTELALLASELERSLVKSQQREFKKRMRATIAPLPSRFTEFLPPLNYGAVESKLIFRSAFPAEDHYSSLKSLRIATIVTLVEDIPEPYQDFLIQNQIRHFKIPVPANKDRTINTCPETIERILRIVLNRHYHPLLIHCNRGKHRTGCVVACLRKVQSYNNAHAVSEYTDYASPKCRPDDIRFIESYDPSRMRNFAITQGWIIPTPPPTPDRDLREEMYWHLKKDSAMELNVDGIAKVELPRSVDDGAEVRGGGYHDGDLAMGRSRGDMVMLTESESAEVMRGHEQEAEFTVDETEVDSTEGYHDNGGGASTRGAGFAMPESER